MSKFKKERLNQMIENAISFEQEKVPFKINSLNKNTRYFFTKPNFYGVFFSSLIISFLFVIPRINSRNFVDLNEINDYITFKVIEDF